MVIVYFSFSFIRVLGEEYQHFGGRECQNNYQALGEAKSWEKFDNNGVEGDSQGSCEDSVSDASVPSVSPGVSEDDSLESSPPTR